MPTEFGEMLIDVYVRVERKAWTILRSRLSVVNGVAAAEVRPTSVGNPPGLSDADVSRGF